ncbi:MAG: hypothetical protein RMA76_05625 [Deltaproteobacteria bacterium]
MRDQLDFGLATTDAPADPDRTARRRRRAPVARTAPQLALPLRAKVQVATVDPADVADAPDDADAPDGADPSDVADRPDVADPTPTLRGKVRIEQVARRVLGPRVIVTLTKNRSTMISCRSKKGVVYLRIHAIFAEAPEDVLVAAVHYVTGNRTSPRDEAKIDAYIEKHREVVKRPAKEAILQPHGEVHDLEAMYDDMNARYFDGRITARITWSRALKNQKRRSMRLGSYCDETKIIRIHPALDQAFVPAYFVASVVFHEMLHEVHGAPEHPESGRREVHTPAFLADERKFADYERARKWEAKHLSRLLRY